MSEEKIIQKIQNLFDLANNNPSEEEAIAAAAKAQELMAKYDIQMSDLNDLGGEEIAEETYYDTGRHQMKKWRRGLATIIAKNFRCKCYFVDKKDVVFYGHKSDAKIALQVFTYLHDAGIKFANNYYYNKKKLGCETKGLMNSYLAGFKKGIQDKLDAQCTALMIVTPQDVEDSYAEKSKSFGTLKTSIKIYDMEAYGQGQIDGKETMNSRKLEVK